MTAYQRDIIVDSGAVVSSAFSTRGLSRIGLQAPALTSCQVFLQVAAGATDPASASFVRMHSAIPWNTSTASPLPWVWNVGPGSAAATLDVSPYAWARLESAPAQVNLVSFTLVAKAAKA